MSRPIAVCILSRDEPVLLRDNIEHLIHREGIQHILVTSHVSIKENREVLDKYGSVIRDVFEEPKAMPFPQNEWRTRMCRTAIRKYNPSWVCPADTDEFWYGLHNLLKVKKGINSVFCRHIIDHYGTRKDPKGEWSIHNMPWCWSYRKHFGKTLHRAISPRMTIKNCSHKPIQRGGVLKELDGLYMHHYPIRDWDRFLIKVNTANYGNPPRRRRTTWRNMQAAGKLREHWETIHCPSREKLEEMVKTGQAHYFLPPPLESSAGLAETIVEG